MNPGQYHEVHPGQVDVESVKVDFQHRSKDRLVDKLWLIFLAIFDTFLADLTLFWISSTGEKAGSGQ